MTPSIETPIYRAGRIAPIEKNMFSDQQRSNGNLRRGRRPDQPKELHSYTKEKYKQNQNGRETLSTPRSRGSRNNKNPTIWKTLEEAKRKQEAIRNRVRKYSLDDEDSDYGDSLTSSTRNISTKICQDLGGNENDSGEHDEEFDLRLPQERSNVLQDKNEPPARYSALPQARRNLMGKNTFKSSLKSNLRKKKGGKTEDIVGFEEQIQQRRLTMKSPSSNGSGRNERTNSSYNSDFVPSINEQIQQRRLSMLSQSSHGSNRKDRSISSHGSIPRVEKMPALTPEEAIRLVMERHAYISDSEDESEDNIESTPDTDQHGHHDNDHPSNDSNSKTIRARAGKRVLTLKQKKQREDTHPRTSNKEGYNYKDNAQHLRNFPSKDQDRSVASPLGTEKTNFQEETKTEIAIDSSISELLDQEPQRRRNDDEKELHSDDNDSENCNKLVYNDNDREEEEEISTATSKQKQVVSASAVANDTKKESNGIVSDQNNVEDSTSSSTSDDEYDDDFLGTDEEILSKQRSNFCSNTNDQNQSSSAEPQKDMESEEKSIEPQFEDNDDDDGEHWGHFSFKTAKTSRSVVSKYSKAGSATSLWLKHVHQNGNGNAADDDIQFFDALQEAGELNSRRSVTMSKEPPTIISDHKNGSENVTDHTHLTVPVQGEDVSMNSDNDDGSDGAGWTGKITNFVGYTISALTGSNEKKEDGGVDEVDAEPNSQPLKVPSFRKSNSPPKNPPTSAVPSRELEIIKKCQEQMKMQHKAIARREREAARNDLENIELRRREEEARAIVRREVIAYRKMMEGMGKGEKLAPLDSKEAAQDYDDRLAMGKTIEEQERKMRLNERNMRKLDMGDVGERDEEPKSCICTCVVS